MSSALRVPVFIPLSLRIVLTLHHRLGLASPHILTYAAWPSIFDQNVPRNEGHLLERSMAAALIKDTDDRLGVWWAQAVAICFINFSPIQYPSLSLPYKNVTHAHWEMVELSTLASANCSSVRQTNRKGIVGIIISIHSLFLGYWF